MSSEGKTTLGKGIRGLKSPSHILLLFLILFASITQVNATVNLTISSQNNKTVTVKDMATLNTISTFQNNQPKNFSYENMVIEVKTNTSSFSFNTIFSSMTAIQQDFIFIVVLMAVFGSLWGGFVLMKKMSGRGK